MPVLRFYPGLQWSSLFKISGATGYDVLPAQFTVSIVYCVVFLSQLMLGWFIMFGRRQKKRQLCVGLTFW